MLSCFSGFLCLFWGKSMSSNGRVCVRNNDVCIFACKIFVILKFFFGNDSCTLGVCFYAF